MQRVRFRKDFKCNAMASCDIREKSMCLHVMYKFDLEFNMPQRYKPYFYNVSAVKFSFVDLHHFVFWI